MCYGCITSSFINLDILTTEIYLIRKPLAMTGLKNLVSVHFCMHQSYQGSRGLSSVLNNKRQQLIT